MTSNSPHSTCPNNNDGVHVVTHNTPLQSNFVFQSIMNPEAWCFLGIDINKVEKATYQPASTGKFEVSEDDLKVLRFAQDTMMQRYKLMEACDVDEYADVPTSELADGKHTTVRLCVPSGWLLQAQDIELVEGSREDEAIKIIASIGRLGDSVGIDLILAP